MIVSCTGDLQTSIQYAYHHKNISMKCIPSYTPTFITGVYTGIPIFLICDPKLRLWVLVKTASAPQSIFGAKIVKI